LVKHRKKMMHNKEITSRFDGYIRQTSLNVLDLRASLSVFVSHLKDKGNDRHIRMETMFSWWPSFQREVSGLESRGWFIMITRIMMVIVRLLGLEDSSSWHIPIKDDHISGSVGKMGILSFSVVIKKWKEARYNARKGGYFFGNERRDSSLDHLSSQLKKLPLILDSLIQGYILSWWCHDLS
jgi:hypothetical protein